MFYLGNITSFWRDNETQQDEFVYVPGYWSNQRNKFEGKKTNLSSHQYVTLIFFFKQRRFPLYEMD